VSLSLCGSNREVVLNMTLRACRASRRIIFFACGAILACSQSAVAAQPNPILNNVFPAGGQAGTSVEVTVAGSGLTKITELRCSHSAISCSTENEKQFRLGIPDSVPNGHYDICALTASGLSSVRSFMVGRLPEQSEAAANDSLDVSESVLVDSVTNGRIEKKGDVDHFAFEAKRGQRVIVECLAERIDSQLRAVLEVFDETGRRQAVNRGFFGIDPLIVFDVPADGIYKVRVFDLVYSGSADHVYRLSISTRPRVVFSVPSFVQSGSNGKVELFGWNLGEASATSPDSQYETATVDLAAPTVAGPPFSLRRRPAQIGTTGIAYHFPGSEVPIRIGISDVPVTRDAADNQSPSAAQPVAVPSEISGQLIRSGELDWFQIDARRGEVFWLEAFGERIGSPVDLDISILDTTANTELARFSDQIQNVGGPQFPSAHSDPGGRWVAPIDGRYLILVRSVIGEERDDPRRVYRLSIRREEPAFDLALVPRRDDPMAMNVPREGRAIADVVAFRRRGLTGAIRVSAHNLPPGFECPDVWLGPGINRAPLIVTANENAEASVVGRLQLVGQTAEGKLQAVAGTTIVRKGVPNGWSRLTDQIGVAVFGESPIRVTADAHQPRGHDLFGDLKVRHAPGTMVDVFVRVERREIEHQAPVVLRGVGLPSHIMNEKATIAAGQSDGHISFYLPPAMPVGKYTIVVQGETTVPNGAVDKQGQRKTEAVTVVTNPVTIEVKPAAFVVELDQDAPREIHRGEVLQVKYSARRVNGFISKMHTELFAPDGVRGVRGRGVSFVGQTDSGTIQIIANKDAPLGQQPFLRLFAVGVLEDEAVYQGSCLLPLEIVE
jgi:hypothetical protein